MDEGRKTARTVVVFVHGAGDGAYEEDGLLAASLQEQLGPSYEVRYPRMPLDDDAAYGEWADAITSALPPAGEHVVLVGHSVGGSVLFRYLCEAPVEVSVTGLFAIAAPFWGADDFWDWDEARLPEGAAEKLAAVPRVVLYHARDDEVVPFAHLDLHAARLPQAVMRPIDAGGHQFSNDLSSVARDIADVAG